MPWRRKSAWPLCRAYGEVDLLLPEVPYPRDRLGIGHGVVERRVAAVLGLHDDAELAGAGPHALHGWFRIRRPILNLSAT